MPQGFQHHRPEPARMHDSQTQSTVSFGWTDLVDGPCTAAVPCMHVLVRVGAEEAGLRARQTPRGEERQVLTTACGKDFTPLRKVGKTQVHKH
jgi:hypothetical protein